METCFFKMSRLRRESLLLSSPSVEEYRECRDRILLKLCAESAESGGYKQQDKFILNIRKTIHSGVVGLGKSLARDVCQNVPAKILRNLLWDCPWFL